MKNLFFLFFLLPMMAMAQTPNDVLVKEAFNGRTEVYFSFKAQDKGEVNTLSKVISIDHRSNSNEVRAYANKKQFADFLALEIPYTLLKSAGEKKTNPKMKGFCKKKARIAGIIIRPMPVTIASCIVFKPTILLFVKYTILVHYHQVESC